MLDISSTCHGYGDGVYPALDTQSNPTFEDCHLLDLVSFLDLLLWDGIGHFSYSQIRPVTRILGDPGERMVLVGLFSLRDRL